MASMSDRASDAGTDAHEQIRQLRDQVDSLMRERVAPTMSGLGERAQDAARQAREKTEALSGRVREMPIASILIAAAAGYLIGRLSR